MKETRMPPAHAARLVENSGRGVRVLVIPRVEFFPGGQL